LSDYDLTTVWRLAGTHAEAAYDALEDAGHWPEWWRGLRGVSELAPGDPGGIGQVARFEWRGPLPYSMVTDIRATRRERPLALEGDVSGDLEGTGAFAIHEAGGATVVTYTWRVRTTKPWMRRSAPVLRPLFVWGHDRIMRAGGEGLARRLGAQLVPPR
jgi:hypothetical protein